MIIYQSERHKVGDPRHLASYMMPQSAPSFFDSIFNTYYILLDGLPGGGWERIGIG